MSEECVDTLSNSYLMQTRFDSFFRSDTVWKFQDFYVTQILREINYEKLEAPKNKYHFNHLYSSEFWIFWHF